MIRKIINKYYILLIIDMLLIVVSFVGAYYFRFHFLAAKNNIISPELTQFYGVLIFVPILWVALFKVLGLYERKTTISIEDEIASIVGAVSVGIMILFAMLFMYRGFWVSRQALLFAWLFTSILMIFTRLLINIVQRYLFKMGKGIRRTLIIGSGEIGQAIALKISKERELGYEAIGFLDDDPDKKNKEFNGIKVLDVIDNLNMYIDKYDINEVIIASVQIPYIRLMNIITESETKGVEFKLVPGFLELLASRISTDDIGGIPLLSIRQIGLIGLNAVLKRVFDFTLSLIGLILISPFFMFMIFAVKIDSKGPVFFSQRRNGIDGKEFNMYKFRSMEKNAENKFDEIAKEFGNSDIRFKAKDDPRITRVGKIIRKLSIDELPQLFNVLKGDMSLVGPRPCVPREYEQFSEWHKKRLRIQPGITGLWQVSGRSELPFEDMVRLDIYYIENWSLWLDVKILIRTIPTVLFGSGAY